MVPPSRGLPSNMLLVAPTSSGPVCDQIQQQTTTVSWVPDPLAWAVDALGLSWEDLDPYAFPLVAILGKVVEKLQDYPCSRIIRTAPGWPNMSWFLDLVATSSQISLSLPNLPNLLTQPFSQILHRNLSNLNLHTWVLEHQLSRTRASQRQWPHELRLVRGSTRSVYEANIVIVVYEHYPLPSLEGVMYCFRSLHFEFLHLKKLV